VRPLLARHGWRCRCGISRAWLICQHGQTPTAVVLAWALGAIKSKHARQLAAALVEERQLTGPSRSYVVGWQAGLRSQIGITDSEELAAELHGILSSTVLPLRGMIAERDDLGRYTEPSLSYLENSEVMAKDNESCSNRSYRNKCDRRFCDNGFCSRLSSGLWLHPKRQPPTPLLTRRALSGSHIDGKIIAQSSSEYVVTLSRHIRALRACACQLSTYCNVLRLLSTSFALWS
jgi:hypothetical protein